MQSFPSVLGLVVGIVVSMFVVVLIFYFRYFTTIDLPLIIYAGSFATWLMFFVVGLYIGSVQQFKFRNQPLIIGVLVFYVASCVESYALFAIFNQPGYAVTAVKLSSFMYSFFLILFLFNNRDLIKSRLLNGLGKLSFGIYLIHMFALLAASRLMFYFFPSINEVSLAYQFALIVLVILSCFLCIYSFNRLLSSRITRLIGFS